MGRAQRNPSMACEEADGFRCALPILRTCDKLARRAKFRLTRRANRWPNSARLTRQEGRIMIVTNAGWDAVDAAASARKVSQGESLVSDQPACRTNDAKAYGK